MGNDVPKILKSELNNEKLEIIKDKDIVFGEDTYTKLKFCVNEQTHKQPSTGGKRRKAKKSKKARKTKKSKKGKKSKKRRSSKKARKSRKRKRRR